MKRNLLQNAELPKGKRICVTIRYGLGNRSGEKVQTRVVEGSQNLLGKIKCQRRKSAQKLEEWKG